MGKQSQSELIFSEALILTGSDLLTAYSQTALSASNWIEFLVKQLLAYLLLQVLMFLFPFLRVFIMKLCLPFRWVHVYLHIHEAQTVYQEVQTKYEEEDDPDSLLDTSYLRTSLISGLDRSDERSLLILSFNRFDNAKRVALAPSKYAFVLLLEYLILAPLTFVFTDAFTTDVGALLHLYFFLGIFGVMMPSMSDYYYIFQALFINFHPEKKWVFVSIIVYIVVTIDLVLRKFDPIFALFIGALFFLAYLVGLFVMAYLAMGGRLRAPKIFYVPDLPTKERYEDKTKFSLEDLDVEV
ncbi:MAG: hypothetical protein ACXAD7_15795 [Candidatus Kariarchaeaceae archaeon]|jgi:hypothetical protein